MIAFTKRNLKLFFRDRAAVMFSLLAVFIIIGLYVLFLGDVWENDLSEIEKAGEIMDNWVMAGVLAVTSVTTTLGILGNMVQDKTEKITKDFWVSPIKRSAIAGGYILSTYAVGLLMSLVALVVAEGYIVFNGGDFLTLEAFIKVILLILVTTLMNTFMMFFIVSLFRSRNAFSTASTVVGTLIGFLTGIYLPIGMYPEGVQWMIKLFPVSHAASAFRQVMLEEMLGTSFGNMPSEMALEIKEELGILYSYGDSVMTLDGNVCVMLMTALLFAVASLWMVSRKGLNK